MYPTPYRIISQHPQHSPDDEEHSRNAGQNPTYIKGCVEEFEWGELFYQLKEQADEPGNYRNH